MNNSIDEKALEHYVEGTATPLEQAAVEKWYNSIEADQDIETTGTQKERIYQKVVAVLNKDFRQGKVVSFKNWMRYAAAIIIIAATGFFLVQVIKKEKESPVAQNKSSIKPGTNRASLQLADGRVIYLDSLAEGAVAVQGNMQIVKLKNGEIVYKPTASGEEDGTVHYNSINTPVGGQYQVMLPDGSKAYLNSISSIKFPTRFTGNERKVHITGEVYLEVTRSKTPFVVDVAGHQKITVLGTQFNVNAYPDEEAIATTLIEGSVKLQNNESGAVTKIKPGQQVRLKGAVTNTLDHVDVDHITAWRKGYFSFNQTPMPEIMRQLSRWYGAKITIDPQVVNETFTGKIPRNADVEKLLRIFEKTNVFRCQIKGNQISILPE